MITLSFGLQIVPPSVLPSLSPLFLQPPSLHRPFTESLIRSSPHHQRPPIAVARCRSPPVRFQPMRSGMPGTGNPSFCNPFDDVLHVDE
ncbi:hypothetical protein OPV22_011780 [Ensete ventricosum]|uniref:Uncharacterized protein n=1 Tax=Ensete ventricosum TaxID=4639 RepID=A0AAV8RLF2_ENSVE|nr:hypothetical protein OPV22_011780 [Ensete ventricosum]